MCLLVGRVRALAARCTTHTVCIVVREQMYSRTRTQVPAGRSSSCSCSTLQKQSTSMRSLPPLAPPLPERTAISRNMCRTCSMTSAYVSIRQHSSAYVSIRQHTSAYVRCHLGCGAERVKRQDQVVELGIRKVARGADLAELFFQIRAAFATHLFVHAHRIL
jgi:hypothetical protein